MSSVARDPDRFLRRRASFTPAYVAAHASGCLAAKARRAVAVLADCRICPRECGADRRVEVGVCGVGRQARVVGTFPHFGEEEALCGVGGSGVILFEGCELGCIFCQSPEISRGRTAREVSADELAAMMLDLQEQGCSNLHLVTPQHVVPEILEALTLAIPRGLTLPLVYNSGGYDAVEALELLDGVVDIYLPDFKLWSPAAARRYAAAPEYPEIARQAIRTMYRQVGDLVFDEDGLALRGLLVRHLLMPYGVADARQIFDFLVREVSPHTYVHLLPNYHPGGRVHDKPGRYPDLDRGVECREYDEALEAARHAGLTRLDRRGLRVGGLI